MFELADLSFYIAIMASTDLGDKSVTTNVSINFIKKQEIRIGRTIKWLEDNWKNYDDNYLTMDQIAIACSLEYTNFRLNNQWEKNSPKLKKWLNNLALVRVYSILHNGGFTIDKTIQYHIQEETDTILKRRTLKQRLFSYKMFHGVFMFMSWVNITGRIFASDQSGDFQCYTYPIYKVGNDTMGPNQTIIEFDIVPEIDPNYDRLPWAHIESWWAVIFSVGVFAVALIFIGISTYLIFIYLLRAFPKNFEKVE